MSDPASYATNPPAAAPEPPRPRIVVLSSRGGGAHATAATALASYLSPDYEVVRVDPFTEVFAPLDTIRFLTRGRLGGEDLYNWLLRRGWHRLATFLCDRYGMPVIARRKKKMSALFDAYLEREKPALLVSVIPLANGAFWTAAERHGVPLLVVPVDLDMANYVHALGDVRHETFRFGLPFDDPGVRSGLAPSSITEDQLRVLGFPVRPEFAPHADRRALRATLELPDDRPIILMLMGASGGAQLRSYTRAFERTLDRAHLVVCTGRNTALRRALDVEASSASVSRTVLGFTERIADFMAASDVVLTKPGPATLCEALYAGVPLVLDLSTPLLRWERQNVELIVRHGLGEAVNSPRAGAQVVGEWLRDDTALHRVRARIAAFPKPDVGPRIRAAVGELLGAAKRSGARVTPR